MLGGQQSRADKAAAAAAGVAPLLEVQVVDAADSMAYDAHDVDDALQLGLLSLDELSSLEIVKQAYDRVRARWGELPPTRIRPALVHELIDLQVSDFVSSADQTLQAWRGHRADEVCAANVRLQHRESLTQQRRALEKFLFARVYRHPRLMQVRAAAEGRLRDLFHGLQANPDRLPLRFRRRADVVGVARASGEYLAGMTDRFCDQQHTFFGSGNGPLSDW